MVAFVGRSNVGKSSLLNRLLGRRRHDRQKPGKTRGITFMTPTRAITSRIPRGPASPVFRWGARGWARLAEELFAGGRVVLTVHLIDPRVPAASADSAVRDYLAARGVRRCALRQNGTDCLPGSEPPPGTSFRKKQPRGPALRRRPAGIDYLRREIVGAIKENERNSMAEEKDRTVPTSRRWSPRRKASLTRPAKRRSPSSIPTRSTFAPPRDQDPAALEDRPRARGRDATACANKT